MLRANLECRTVSPSTYVFQSAVTQLRRETADVLLVLCDWHNSAGGPARPHAYRYPDRRLSRSTEVPKVTVHWQHADTLKRGLQPVSANEQRTAFALGVVTMLLLQLGVVYLETGSI